MLQSYLPVAVLIAFTGAFVTMMILASILLGPKKNTSVKDEAFECGTVGSGDPTQRMSVKFYLVAMIFILFDIEIVFLYPWAVQAAALGWLGFYAVLSFLLVVVVGLAYVWKRGVLNWS